MKKQEWFMAVQVVDRKKVGVDDVLSEWYEGEKRALLAEAKDDKKRLAKEFPGTTYTVIHVTVQEIGNEVVK